MKIPFSEIEDAFLFVNMGTMYSNNATVNIATGKIYYSSEFEDEDEMPDDIGDPDTYVDIPHKNELDLGKELVFNFASTLLPEAYEDVEEMFMRPGAYSRYKNLLEQKGLLDKWHEYEDKYQKEALLEWCRDNNLDVE